MFSRLTMARQIVANHGFGWLVTRLAYELQVRGGFQERRFRQRSWDPNELARWLRPGVPADPAGYADFRQQHSPRFFFDSRDRPDYAAALGPILGQSGRQKLTEEAQSIRQGCLRYFFSHSGATGFPPQWHRNPFTGQQTAPAAHWSRIPMFSTATGDLKFIWEPGRFASAYTLARAYWATGNEAHAETFWQLVESWVAANPPNHGAHWRCGQETSLRLMAWCFAFHATADSPAMTPERLAMLVGAIAAQADRVAGDHLYARLQKNNHAISEGAGLWTVGLLFPELAMAEQWREAGRTILEHEAGQQIYDDGAYIQHSTNYHRLMLQDYLWAIRLGELNGYELSPSLQARVSRAGDFLFQLQDEPSGQTPNYGANDGALILPLNECDYRDFRPVLGALHYLFYGSRLFSPGPWDEDLVWLFGPEALARSQAAVAIQPLQAPAGGYYTLRGGESWGLIRCATFQDRPSQADGLHLDIWRKGINVACDAGTYLYYAEPPWDNPLVSTLVHNTVSVDGLDQMKRGPRFLWLNWPKATVFHYLTSDCGLLGYFEGAHDGYHRLSQPITHRRAVLRADPDVWVIVDDLVGDGRHDFRLHWLLADLPYEAEAEGHRLVLDTGDDHYGLSLYACQPADAIRPQFAFVRGTNGSGVQGWQSAYYGVRQPAISVTLTTSASAPCRLVSVFAPEVPDAAISVSERQIRVLNGQADLRVVLRPPAATSIVECVELASGDRQERLIIGAIAD